MSCGQNDVKTAVEWLTKNNNLKEMLFKRAKIANFAKLKGSNISLKT